MPTPIASRLRADQEHLACAECGAVYHRTQLFRGRGRRLWEHPEHEYAPCGHSQTWFGWRVTPAPDSAAELTLAAQHTP